MDYLVDSSSHPWLLEVNGTPSLAVAHHDPAVEALIHNTKVGACGDKESAACLMASAGKHCEMATVAGMHTWVLFFWGGGSGVCRAALCVHFFAAVVGMVAYGISYHCW